MPFTPFHFGFGLAAKAATPKYFYLLFFIAIQVIIDVESLYNLVQDNYPVHGFLHTFLGGGLLAGLSSLLVVLGLRWLRRISGGRERLAVLVPVVVTAFLSTWSHVALDSVMHADCRPFLPFTENNPFWGFIGNGTLHVALVGMGLAGGVVLLLRLGSSNGVRS